MVQDLRQGQCSRWFVQCGWHDRHPISANREQFQISVRFGSRTANILAATHVSFLAFEKELVAGSFPINHRKPSGQRVHVHTWEIELWRRKIPPWDACRIFRWERRMANSGHAAAELHGKQSRRSDTARSSRIDGAYSTLIVGPTLGGGMSNTYYFFGSLKRY